jgi:hypothetical protein
MEARLERLENKVDKLIEGLAALNSSHVHLTSEIKKIADENEENTTYRTQSKAIVVAALALISFIGIGAVAQCIAAIARPFAQTYTTPEPDTGKSFRPMQEKRG